MLLAGDVGGTKTLLGLFARASDRPQRIETASLRTLEFSTLGDMIDRFLTTCGVTERIETAAFGVAGVVTAQVARLTNVPWVVDAAEVSERFEIPRVSLLNDLEAMAWAVPVLEPDELAVLQEGVAQPTGNAALIAAGTGLGQAMLHNVDGRFLPFPSEGGHADFAARTPREIELLQHLVRVYGRAEVEQVVSGIGLVNIYRFTHGLDLGEHKPREAVLARGRSASAQRVPSAPVADGCPCSAASSDPLKIPALLSAAALARQCPCCVEALDLFVAAYGAEAGNLALRAVATAGLYVGGGIAPKILPALETGGFLAAFRGKEPMADLMATIPVSVILNPEAALLGGAVYANTRV